jgi:hypothetical protein
VRAGVVLEECLDDQLHLHADGELLRGTPRATCPRTTIFSWASSTAATA